MERHGSSDLTLHETAGFGPWMEPGAEHLARLR